MAKIVLTCAVKKNKRRVIYDSAVRETSIIIFLCVRGSHSRIWLIFIGVGGDYLSRTEKFAIKIISQVAKHWTSWYFYAPC